MSTPLGCNYCCLLGPVWRDPEINSPGTAGSNAMMERAKKWELFETSSIFILLTSIFTLLKNKYFACENPIDKELKNLCHLQCDLTYIIKWLSLILLKELCNDEIFENIFNDFKAVSFIFQCLLNYLIMFSYILGHKL